MTVGQWAGATGCQWSVNASQ